MMEKTEFKIGASTIDNCSLSARMKTNSKTKPYSTTQRVEIIDDQWQNCICFDAICVFVRNCLLDSHSCISFFFCLPRFSFANRFVLSRENRNNSNNNSKSLITIILNYLWRQ